MQIQESDEESSVESKEDKFAGVDGSVIVGESGTRGTVITSGADSNVFNLMENIEACVWDNIKLAHINSKLLEFAKNQAIELEAMKSS